MRYYLCISRRSKLLAKLASVQSDSYWTLDDVTVLLGHGGFVQTGGKGSHRVFTHPAYPFAITLAAHGNKIKTGYIREIRDAFQTIEEQNKKQP